MKQVVLLVVLSSVCVACGGETKVIPYSEIEGADGDGWHAFRADAQRTGLSTTGVVESTPVEKWRFEDINTTDYGAAKGSPSVDGDIVYIGSDDARFQALDRETGEVRWSTVLENTTQGIHGSPAIGKDHVYIGGYNGTLYAFDKTSGDEIWRYQKGFQIGASPILVPEHGRVYNTHERSSSGGGHIVAVDATTGDEIWDYAIRAHPHSSVAVSVKHDILVVGDNLAIVHAIDTQTGDKIWDYSIPQTSEDQSDVKTTPTIVEDKNLVVVGAWSDKVHAFDIETGDIAWEFDTKSNIMGSTAYSPERGIVYVGAMSPTKALIAINVDDGSEAWRFEPGSNVMSSPAISADESVVVVGSNNGNLYAIDAETGEQIWRHAIGGSITASPAMVGNELFISSKKGDLVAIETVEQAVQEEQE